MLAPETIPTDILLAVLRGQLAMPPPGLTDLQVEPIPSDGFSGNLLLPGAVHLVRRPRRAAPLRLLGAKTVAARRARRAPARGEPPARGAGLGARPPAPGAPAGGRRHPHPRGVPRPGRGGCVDCHGGRVGGARRVQPPTGRSRPGEAVARLCSCWIASRGCTPAGRPPTAGGAAPLPLPRPARAIPAVPGRGVRRRPRTQVAAARRPGDRRVSRRRARIVDWLHSGQLDRPCGSFCTGAPAAGRGAGLLPADPAPRRRRRPQHRPPSSHGHRSGSGHLAGAGPDRLGVDRGRAAALDVARLCGSAPGCATGPSQFPRRSSPASCRTTTSSSTSATAARSPTLAPGAARSAWRCSPAS